MRPPGARQGSAPTAPSGCARARRHGPLLPSPGRPARGSRRGPALRRAQSRSAASPPAGGSTITVPMPAMSSTCLSVTATRALPSTATPFNRAAGAAGSSFTCRVAAPAVAAERFSTTARSSFCSRSNAASVMVADTSARRAASSSAAIASAASRRAKAADSTRRRSPSVFAAWAARRSSSASRRVPRAASSRDAAFRSASRAVSSAFA